MMIAGIAPNSFVDYPSKIAMVVFVPGCNYNCWYCHNRQLIKPNDTCVLYSTSTILSDLERKRDFLDAVVISGGEPTLQTKLADFAKSIKELGFLVKLDTNGSNPSKIKSLLDENLIDYIAMDIKAPFEKYEAVCGKSVDTSIIQESIKIILNHAPEYEFRTTLVPELDKGDIIEIAGYIKGAMRYSIQQYIPTQHTKNIKPHANSFINECANAVSKMVDSVRVLGVK